MITFDCQCGTRYDAPSCSAAKCPACGRTWDTLPGQLRQAVRQQWGIKADAKVAAGVNPRPTPNKQ